MVRPQRSLLRKSLQRCPWQHRALGPDVPRGVSHRVVARPQTCPGRAPFCWGGGDPRTGRQWSQRRHGLQSPRLSFCAFSKVPAVCHPFKKSPASNPSGSLHCPFFHPRRCTASTAGLAGASRRRRRSGAQAPGGIRHPGRPSTTTSRGTACPSTPPCPATRPAAASGLRGSPAAPLPTLPRPTCPSPSTPAALGLVRPLRQPGRQTRGLSGTRLRIHLTPESRAPCELCPEAVRPPLSSRRTPTVVLDAFSHRDVRCAEATPSPLGVSGG